MTWTLWRGSMPSIAARREDALLGRVDEFFRNSPADDVVFKDDARTGRRRLHRDDHVSVLAVPAGLLGKLQVHLGHRSRDRFAVSHARPADIRLDAELA